MDTGIATRIALREDQFAALAGELDSSFETAAVLAATPVSSDGREHAAERTTLLARTLTWIPETAYAERHALGLSISSRGWVPAFRAAIDAGRVPVFVHTHPDGDAKFSAHDDAVDTSLADVARTLGAPAYASLVVAGRADAPAVAARICRFDRSAPEPDGSRVTDAAATQEFDTVEAVRIAGHALRLLLPPDATDHTEPTRVDDVFDRQVRMLGSTGQRSLAAINAAVIGAGGTGSAVAVQLARLGVGALYLIDDDTVTKPTPTRGHGMTTADSGRSKVDVLGQHLREIGLGTQVVEVDAPLHDPEALRALQHTDVVFSCVDGHGARLILNRYAYAHLSAVIDMAVLVSVTEAGAEINERVTWIAPGTACLLCRGRLDAARAYAENLDPETRKRLAGEGYVEEVQTPQPAVVTLTTMTAALAATEFLLRFAGIGSAAATELLLRPHVGELRRNRTAQRAGCFCSDPGFLGRGQEQPYLDLMWPTPPLGGVIGS